MTDNEIIKKAIEKAVKNGYDDITMDIGIKIFSHPFAKAFWGEEEIELPNPEWTDDLPVCDCDLEHDTLPAWQYHLQKMILEENPLQYLEKFLDKRKQ